MKINITSLDGAAGPSNVSSMTVAALFVSIFTFYILISAFSLHDAHGTFNSENGPFIIKNFSLDIKKIEIDYESPAADSDNFYFTSSKSGCRLYHKVLFKNGAGETNSTAIKTGFPGAPRPCPAAKIDEKKNSLLYKNMICDGRLLFSAPFEIDNEKYLFAIASDWHLYIFSRISLSGKRSFALYKTPLSGEPSHAFYLDNRIFVITREELSCFSVIKTPKAREKALIIPSTAHLNASEAVEKSLNIIYDNFNDFECAFNFASSRNLVFKKLLPINYNLKKTHDFIGYALMGPGAGNVNIYGVTRDFKFSRRTNFNGAITSFSLIDETAPVFVIFHTQAPIFSSAAWNPPADKSPGRGINEWTLSPPSTLKPALKIPVLKKPGALSSGGTRIYSQHKTAKGAYLRIMPAEGDRKMAVLSAVNENDDTIETLFTFNIHDNIIASSGFTSPSALSSNVSRPLAFFYDKIDKMIRIYDVKNNREYDSFYHDFSGASIENVKFSFDNELVMLNSVHHENDDITTPAVCTLFVYRVVNRSFSIIAAHKSIGDFDCFKYDGNHNIIMIYGNDKPYCNSLGILTID